MVAVIRGRSTASGKRFDILAPTAAHRSLPFGAVVLVENLANGRTIELRIADRGPYVQGRIIGLWLAAAQRLGLEQQGVGLVGLTILSPAILSPALPSLVASGRRHVGHARSLVLEDLPPAAGQRRVRGTMGRGAEPTGGLARRSDAVGRSATIAAPLPSFAASRSLGGASTRGTRRRHCWGCTSRRDH
jgi:hypothetical protein